MKRTLTTLLLLLALPCQAGTLDDLGSDVVGYWDLRSGSTHDWSGTGNDATSTTDFSYTNRGGQFPATTSKITVPDDGTLQLTALSVTVCGDLTSQTTEALVHKQDAGGTNYSVALTSTNVNLYDGTNTRTIAADITGHHCITVQATDSATGEVFLDGILEGALDAASALSVDNAPLIIGNDHDDGDNASNPLWCVVIVDRELTDAEAAGLYSQLASIRWPTRGWYKAAGVYGPDLLTDGDQEDAGVGAYYAGNSATLTKEDGNVLAGTQVLRVAHNGTTDPFADEAGILTVGDTYLLEGWARGDGTGYPEASIGDTIVWTGTVAATWQRFDAIAPCTAGTYVVLKTKIAVGGYSEFDNVTVRKVESPEIQGSTGWGAYESDDTAAGYIPGTPIEILSGTWDVVVEEVDGNVCKVLENDGAGHVAIPTTMFTGDPTQDAYGTISMKFKKLNTNGFYIYMGNQTDTGAGNGFNGYLFGFTLAELADAYLITNGMNAGTQYQSSASAVPFTWFDLRITRDITNDECSVYINDTLVTDGGGGSNPFTEGTYTESNYIILDMDDGDKVVLGCRDGGVGGISKKRGVW